MRRFLCYLFLFCAVAYLWRLWQPQHSITVEGVGRVATEPGWVTRLVTRWRYR